MENVAEIVRAIIRREGSKWTEHFPTAINGLSDRSNSNNRKMGIGEAMTLALFLKLIIHFAIASAGGERLRYFGNIMNSESGRPLIEG